MQDALHKWSKQQWECVHDNGTSQAAVCILNMSAAPVSKVHAARFVSSSSSALWISSMFQDLALQCVQLQQGGRVLDTPVQHL